MLSYTTDGKVDRDKLRNRFIRADYDAADELADALDAANADLAALKTRAEQLRVALRFYANKEHLWGGKMPDDFDTVSGEPQNWWFGDECPEWGVEDGSVAKHVLHGKPLDFEGEEPPPPIEGEV